MNQVIQHAIKITGSAYKLAKLAGVSEPAVARARDGKTTITPSTAFKLSRAVGGVIPPEHFSFPHLAETTNRETG